MSEMNEKAELLLLKNWVERAETAGLFGGQPLGGAYADPRLESSRYRIANRYAVYDAFIAKKLPHMKGKYLSDVKMRITDLEDRR
jgi:hypothetical protein